MKTGNWDYVYLTRDSYGYFGVWNTNIGIVKYVGCVAFRSARSLGKNGQKDRYEFTGLLGTCCTCSMCNGPDVRKQFGFIPAEGTAWLVNTTTLKRKRIDRDMALIDPDTGKLVR